MILNTLYQFASGDWRGAVIELLFTLLIVLFALSVHEAAHGYIAYKMGDPTAKNLGRLTINPTKHLEPIGFIAMLVFGFGWAKPVPINTRNFKNPKTGMALSGIAGPASNLLMGIVGTILYGFLTPWCIKMSLSEGLVANLANVLPMFFYLLAMYNFIFMAFNLIPLPPFDGSRFFYAFLPIKVYFKVMKYERYILIGMFIVLFILSRLFNFSPFTWIADKIFTAIATPFYRLGINVFF